MAYVGMTSGIIILPSTNGCFWFELHLPTGSLCLFGLLDMMMVIDSLEEFCGRE